MAERLFGMSSSVPEDVLAVGYTDDDTSWLHDDVVRQELVDAMFRHHYQKLLRLAFVMVGNRETAEDVVQDAFAALFRNRRALRDADSAEAYVRSAVLNRCRSWFRRQATQRAARPLLLLAKEQQSAEETIIDRDQTGALVALLRTLARRQREVLACRFVLELSVTETAALLEISEGSVKTHTHRGLKTLEQRLEAVQ